MTKKHKKTLIATTLITLLPALLGLCLWNQFPEQIAIHFNFNGVADGWANKTFVILGLPLFLTVIQLFSVYMTLNDPKFKNIGGKMLTLTFWCLPILSWICNFSIFAIALGYHLDIEKWISLFVGVLLIIIGNYMTKNHQNYTVGIKLPWTLNSRENWNKTHRLSSKLWILGGILFLLNAFLKINPLWFFPVIMILTVIVPIIYSFALYKKGI